MTVPKTTCICNVVQLTDSEIAFIQTHAQAEPTRLLLQKYPNIDLKKVVAQIAARQKVTLKLPTWVGNPNVIFPVAVSVEQSSSELTAAYKSQLVEGQLLDGTGGMGIDTSFFAKNCKTVIYLEQNKDLCEVARHNFDVFGIKNIDVQHQDCIDFLATTNRHFDWIYLDPARRDTQQQRVFKLADCMPNVVEILPLLTTKASRILVKASPMVDLRLVRAELKNQVKEIHIIALENDCKEVLLVIDSAVHDNIKIVCNNLKKSNNQLFVFQSTEEPVAQIQMSEPLRYLYEPHVGVLKAGAFRILSERFDCAKLALNTHLYTANRVIENFPGRAFEVVAVVKADAKALASFLPEKKANVTTRNFPISVDNLRKQLRIKEGGNVYLFAATLANNDKRIIVCKPL
jgi:16S rRNA G966 N2-methylase RsmD